MLRRQNEHTRLQAGTVRFVLSLTLPGDNFVSSRNVQFWGFRLSRATTN